MYKEKDEWHDNVVSYLRRQLNLKDEPPPPFKTKIEVKYQPDIAFEKDGKYVIIEVETTRTTKTLEDLLFPSLMDEPLDRVIIIFSDKDGKGQRRVDKAKVMEQILRHHFTSMPKIDIQWIKDEKDEKLTGILKNLV